MQNVFEIFMQITKIPHCSGKTEKLRRFLTDFAEKRGYRVDVDGAGNVMASRPKSRLTLQAHYDMVCIGRAPAIEMVVEDGWMRAKGSSLGADNGIGVAIMLHLIEEGTEADFLFTNDEEIGLVGAENIDLAVKTPYLLNLDSEELGKVYVGCAGGEDIHLHKAVEYIEPSVSGQRYKITARAPGGHSGVNIADAIPNAITELAAFIVRHGAMEVVSFEGGERINAIPRHAEAVVWLPEGHTPATDRAEITVEALDRLKVPIAKEGRMAAKALFGFAHGVRAWNRELDLPQSSINLATVSLENGRMQIALSARAMDNEDLSRLVAQSRAAWEALGFVCRTEGRYPAWRPQISDFARTLRQRYEEVVPGTAFAAIHAGLECALFAERFPALQIASIGPTILDPHSDRERVEMGSVEKIVEVVERTIADLSAV